MSAELCAFLEKLRTDRVVAAGGGSVDECPTFGKVAADRALLRQLAGEGTETIGAGTTNSTTDANASAASIVIGRTRAWAAEGAVWVKRSRSGSHAPTPALWGIDFEALQPQALAARPLRAAFAQLA